MLAVEDLECHSNFIMWKFRILTQYIPAFQYPRLHIWRIILVILIWCGFILICIIIFLKQFCFFNLRILDRNKRFSLIRTYVHAHIKIPSISSIFQSFQCFNILYPNTFIAHVALNLFSTRMESKFSQQCGSLAIYGLIINIFIFPV